MAKQKEVAPPAITEELLREAAEIFREQREYEAIVRPVYSSKETKQRFTAVGQAMEALRKAWSNLPEQEREWFFMLVNPTQEGAADFLLGPPTDDGPYGLCHAHDAHQKVEARLAAACNAYGTYKSFAALGGRHTEYAHNALTKFLMLHWEKATGEPAVYVRDPAGTVAIGVAKWVGDCLTQMQAMGVEGVEPAYAESRVENMYKQLRQPRLRKKR